MALLKTEILRVLDLTEAVDIYSEWIDAADAAEREQTTTRRSGASSSRHLPPLSDEE